MPRPSLASNATVANPFVRRSRIQPRLKRGRQTANDKGSVTIAMPSPHAPLPAKSAPAIAVYAAAATHAASDATAPAATIAGLHRRYFSGPSTRRAPPPATAFANPQTHLKRAPHPQDGGPAISIAPETAASPRRK